MDKNDLYNQIDKFVSNVTETTDYNFWIDLQPNTVVFGGEFVDSKGLIKPIDLKDIGKSKCSQLADFIAKFHKIHTDNGNNKWNRAMIRKSKTEGYFVDFIWDIKWELDEKNARLNQNLDLIKWYWDK
ncbi:hypothetical protein [Chondrinema litorale]|uniref:hypothetical protein n=1 Tax=Chondrinema litorale TaxID=2994555 RepID=UPI002542AD89|nr:hypothetical protein [Chondrinema litorale]UZR95973.1 hypothetical protein OQ292_09125 [Chondrinema litorale]